DVNIAPNLSSDAGDAFVATLTIPESDIRISYDGELAVSAGDTLQLSVENIGGVDTTFSSENCYVKDLDGNIVYETALQDSIQTGQKKSLALIPVSDQVISGDYHLFVQLRDNSNDHKRSYYARLAINGIEASLETKTEQQIYLIGDEVVSASKIGTGQAGITDGELWLGVKKVNLVGTGEGKFVDHIVEEDYMWLPGVTDMDVLPDGSILA
ncbi:MAG: hypothetical protein GWO26_21510, partial [Phycisphaerae bacterium]|nr:hypothetical protein [Phycisphaerae bacterium]